MVEAESPRLSFPSATTARRGRVRISWMRQERGLGTSAVSIAQPDLAKIATSGV